MTIDPAPAHHPLRLVLVAALTGGLLLGALTACADVAPRGTPAPTTLIGWQAVPEQQAVRGVQFLDVAWTGHAFVAVGSGLDDNGATLDSNDGLTWHRQAGATPGERPNRIAAGPSGVVAIGMIDDRPASWSSRDGLTWTAAANAFPANASGTNTIAVTDVVAMGSGWLAVGREDPGCRTDCGLDAVRSLAWTSRDGLSWETAPDQEALVGGGINAVSAYDGGYVAAGVAAGRAAIWTSADGSTWSRVPDSPALDPAGSGATTVANGVASSDGIVVVGGTESGDRPAVRAWWSTDGAEWTSAAERAFEGGTGMSVAAISNGFLITGRQETATCHAGVWESGDGLSWRCAATDARFDGFGPYAAASGPIDLIVGLTTVGHDENTDVGLPGAAWWRSATAGAPGVVASDLPSPTPGLVAVIDVHCGPGAPTLGSDRVRASRDGIRLRVTGAPGWDLGIEHESGRISVRLEAGSQELVLPIAPGDVELDCAWCASSGPAR